MARTKINPLSVVPDDPYMRLPLSEEQVNALRDALVAAMRFRRLEISLGVLDDAGEPLTMFETEGLREWLANAENAELRRMIDERRTLAGDGIARAVAATRNG